MREAAFAKQNKDKWIRFENVLRNNIQVAPDELSALYIEITDHLSYAQTFYPKSNTLRYLNGLSVLAHQKIYKTKRESRKRFITFYTKEFPLFFAQYQKQLLIAFATFAIFSIVGAYSAATDGDFVRLILGDGYVNMTLQNIEDGDPMRVYKEMNELEMSLGITINNIRVALMAFAFGLFLSLGTLFIIMRNAIMLGSFQYFFYDQGLLWESARTIWIHGTIEISVIIIAGCAGLVLGNSILFPGTYSRVQSFVKGAKDGVKILISTIPFFIVAGFLEGFVTRHTEMPDWLAIFIIGGSLALILFYYVFYPLHLQRKIRLQLEERNALPEQ
ncbi:stage II sporulation protein M [Marinirhabdus gelatinilytica]|uniref:Putative membrane protein SpoIIM required for sporulation n=1 Tax=Marinirhabdus gelatinilytica TaxID=1703343 RepID=A0A370QFD9_9FLAO|nr:stage II sporulation protein M [Marinirhabdus gelatinilytica]RDK87083.1 putative membrane protein SpoIIM required for sporulation [Marinirhabdus gelatinilytica]